LTKLILFDKKQEKTVNDSVIEIDLDDLESLSGFKHGEGLVDIPTKKIANKTVLEWFAVDGISFWWFALPIIHAQYIEAMLFVDRLSVFLEQHSIDLIKLNGAYNKISLVKQICKSRNIKLEISGNYRSFLTKQYFKKISKNKLYKKITQRKFKKRIDLFTKKRGYVKPDNGSIIITSPGVYRREIYDAEKGIPKKEEFFIQPILNLLQKNKISFTCFDLDYTFRGNINALRERLETGYSWMPIEILINEEKDESVIKSISLLKKSIKELMTKEIETLFVYKNISLWEYLQQTFEDLFLEPNLPTYVYLTKKLENFLREIKPKLIIQIYETGPYAKAFEFAAKKIGIKTIAIQHGLIPSDYPEYMFKEIKNERLPYGNPIADLTLVFGEFYKKILTENGSYPKDKVAIIGNPTYYNIEKIKKTLKRDSILEKYNLPDKKILLVPLSHRFVYRGKSRPDHILLNTLYESFRNRNDTIVLIRPHPDDMLSQTLLEKIYPTENFRISTGTLFEDLCVCDTVIVLPITTLGSEAVVFEKPVVVVNLDENKSTNGFRVAYKHLIEHDCAILSSMNELVSKIDSIKKGEIWKTEKSSKRKEFLYSYFNFGKSVDLMKLIYKN